jgi:hypothetical protein
VDFHIAMLSAITRVVPSHMLAELSETITGMPECHFPGFDQHWNRLEVRS